MSAQALPQDGRYRPSPISDLCIIVQPDRYLTGLLDHTANQSADERLVLANPRQLSRQDKRQGPEMQLLPKVYRQPCDKEWIVVPDQPPDDGNLFGRLMIEGIIKMRRQERFIQLPLLVRCPDPYTRILFICSSCF